MSFLSTLQDGATKLILWGHAHSSALYTAVGVSSGLGAVISGIAVTPENTRRLDNERDERARLGIPEMTFWEKAKMIGPSYIPCALLFATSATCIILNTLKEERKIATLAGLYSMSEKSFEEYREKVKEMFGERKESKVRDEVAADKARLCGDQTVYISTGDGNYPCLDAWSNTKFRSSQIAIENARIAILDRLRQEMYITLEDVYYEMHLPVRRNTDGLPMVDRSDIGWSQDDHLEFHYTYQPDSNGEPMMVITFYPSPHPNFNKFW